VKTERVLEITMAAASGHLWIDDITYLRTWEGWPYLVDVPGEVVCG